MKKVSCLSIHPSTSHPFFSNPVVILSFSLYVLNWWTDWTLGNSLSFLSYNCCIGDVHWTLGNSLSFFYNFSTFTGFLGDSSTSETVLFFLIFLLFFLFVCFFYIFLVFSNIINCLYNTFFSLKFSFKTTFSLSQF